MKLNFVGVKSLSDNVNPLTQIDYRKENSYQEGPENLEFIETIMKG